MGPRATDKLKEIEELRSGLGHKLNELEGRFPFATFGRKAAAMLAGGSAGGTALAFALRRMRGSRRAKSPKQATQQPSVVVNVFPKAASWIAAAGVAAWAGARLYEAITRARSSDDGQRPAVVRPMPDAGRRSGAGS
ncbi:MAG TPA: hypothetical protein VFA34_01775 [Actinomycetota bacterium]|nr:hypothetical protein [Actinomycetota bacterium]